MKSIKMKGKNVEEAVAAAAAVLGVSKESVKVNVISEGKPAVMGIIGGEEAEVEAVVQGSAAEEATQALQNILDKMGLLAIAELEGEGEAEVRLAVKGEDMGRIIGKEGAMLKSLEVVVGAMLRKSTGVMTRVHIDAGGYMDKREKSLQRLAAEVADEVEQTGAEKVLPYMEASDRRMIHLYLQENPKVKSYSVGEGKDRRMVIAPK
jgi:spoIIIJ-associated protein